MILKKLQMPEEHTLCGLEKWHHAEFEKLGWMVLASSNGYKGKIAEYIKGLHRLHTALIDQQKVYKDSDKKYDIMVLEKETKIL